MTGMNDPPLSDLMVLTMRLAMCGDRTENMQNRKTLHFAFTHLWLEIKMLPDFVYT